MTMDDECLETTGQGHVACEARGPIATVTLSNPSKRNAMSARMWRELPEVLAALATDSSIRAVVLTGDGEHFCAGADISSLPETLGLDDANEGAGLPLSAPERGEEALAAFPKPTVAAIRGVCVGGGVQLALACDLRITTSSARFGVTPAKIGVVYPPRTTARLTTTVGPAAAKRLLFTGELISAQEACRIGLAGEVVPDESLDDAVDGLLTTMMSRSQLSMCAAKTIVDAAAMHGSDGPHGAVAQAEPWQREMARAADAREGIAAFLEHRAPVFTWR